VRTAYRPGSVSETNNKCQIKFKLLHVIVTDYCSGLAITESYAIAPHDSLLPQT